MSKYHVRIYLTNELYAQLVAKVTMFHANDVSKEDIDYFLKDNVHHPHGFDGVVLAYNRPWDTYYPIISIIDSFLSDADFEDIGFLEVSEEEGYVDERGDMQLFHARTIIEDDWK